MATFQASLHTLNVVQQKRRSRRKKPFHSALENREVRVGWGQAE